jgi:hypothetical protein
MGYCYVRLVGLHALPGCGESQGLFSEASKTSLIAAAWVQVLHHAAPAELENVLKDNDPSQLVQLVQVLKGQ